MRTRARRIALSAHPDERGLLVVGEIGGQLPFPPARFFALVDVPHDVMRGAHAHKQCEQFLVALSGSCRVTLIDSSGRDSFTLDTPREGVYVPAMTWLVLSHFAPGSTVLVLTSDPYDGDDYIRTLEEFERLCPRQ